MITVNFKQKVVYPKLKENQVILCTNTITFCDGTKHKTGQKFVVEKVNQSYFNIFLNQSYKVLNDSTI